MGMVLKVYLRNTTFLYSFARSTHLISKQLSVPCYFLPDAAEEMRIFFAWGSRHPRNRYKLLAGFTGQCYQELLDELKIMNSCREFSDEKYRLFPQEYQLRGFVLIYLWLLVKLMNHIKWQFPGNGFWHTSLDFVEF